jgi:deferrochelatase/peroxidase EfeB
MPPGSPCPPFPDFPARLPLRAPDRGADTARIEDNFLDAVQGNILKGHGRDFLRLVFFRFTVAARAADFLAAVAAPAPAGGRRWVTSALEQWVQRQVRHDAWRFAEFLATPGKMFPLAEGQRMRSVIRQADTQLFRSLMLTRSGLAQLGVTLGSDPFAGGMKTRLGLPARSGEMNSAPYDREGTEQDFHGVFLLAGDDPATLDASVQELAAWSRDFRVALLPESEAGFTWREPHVPGAPGPYGNGYFPPREPFGFADGISQPHFFSDERAGQPMRPGGPAAWAWTDLRLDQVFIRDGVHAGGSFAALLKIEQRVATFRRHEADIAALLQDRFSLTADQAEYLAPAVLMGRTRHGYPLGEILGRLAADEPRLRALFPAGPPAPDANDPAAGPPQPPPWLNEFDFTHQAPSGGRGLPRAGGCPFHVHLRKMNPRATGSNHGTPQDFIGAQPVRRGAAYDPAGLLTRREANPATDWPEEGTGLLFLAYMADLAVQFEMAATSWAPDPTFPFPGGADPVLAAPTAGLHFGPLTLPAMPPVLKRLGGVYLYVPSIRWLQRGGA